MKLSDNGEREFVIVLGGTIASTIGCGVAYDLGAKGTAFALAGIAMMGALFTWAIASVIADMAKGKS